MTDFVIIESSLVDSGMSRALDHSVNIISEVHDLKDEIILNRRWFHANPELSMVEFITAAKVAELLRSYGISEVFEKVGQTGVVALIRGSEPGPCIGLRADMDALPIQETADIPYRSLNNGVMHACGEKSVYQLVISYWCKLYSFAFFNI
jgi:metal-dependent amidase/aminoacylase/carboxypeptidase family protein